MKAVQISKPGGNFEVVERPIPEPGRGQVRIKVEACGICHSDALVKEGHWPGIQYPRVPGHEIAGRIDAIGPDVTLWKPGQRVGVGWHGGHCFQCDPCRRGDFINCKFEKITAIHFDGGYAEYMVAPAEAVALMPDDLPADEAAPLMCAGITVFNALRNSARARAIWSRCRASAASGILGFSMPGRWVFAPSPSDAAATSKRWPRNSALTNMSTPAPGIPPQALQKMGGANVILATAPDSKSMSALVNGLGPNGTLMVVGAGIESLNVTPLQLIGGSKSIRGWASGTARDSQDTLEFSVLSGVRPMIERYPLEKAADAYQQMISGKARFRVVLTMGS